LRLETKRTIMKRVFDTIPPKYLPYIFIAFYLALNLLQAHFTLLTSDEGYYWYLSSHIEWGYYDHPPLLPLLISIGRHLFSGELGVRLMNIMFMCAALFFLIKLLSENGARPKPHLYLIILSLPLFNYITCIVFPDTPLVALSMAYLYFYKRFLAKETVPSALFMGLALSGMLYAKYHAVLLPLFVVASNLLLLRNKKFLFSLGIAAALFLPHIYWQYLHDFVSFKYHLVGRSHSFELPYLTDYIGTQLLVLGPALIFVPFIYKTKNLFDRALKVTVIGTLAFFMTAVLKGYVHFHWTSICLFPLIILGYSFYDLQKKRKLLWYLTAPTLLLVVFLRAYLMCPIAPFNTFNHVDYFHGRHEWAHDIQRIAGTDPVVFESQLREAPLYSFYSGMRGVALYPEENKKSQYEIRQEEDSLQGKNIVIMKNGGCERCSTLVTTMGKTNYYLRVAHFSSYQNILVTLSSAKKLLPGNRVRLKLDIINHRSDSLTFDANSYGEPPRLYCIVYAKNGDIGGTYTVQDLSKNFAVGPKSVRSIEAEISVNNADLMGWTIAFGFTDGLFNPSVNTKRLALRWE
jgi:hypothetical protein